MALIQVGVTFTRSNWLNDTSGAFNVAANWQDQNGNSGVPGPGDDAAVNFNGITVSVTGSTSVNSLPRIPVSDSVDQLRGLKATGTSDARGAEVPTVVPRGAENGAVLPASPALQIAPVCTDRREGTSAA